MKKVFLKVISGVSIFMFTVGFATHAYMEANNIKLTKAKTAYAMTAKPDVVLDHAREYIGLSNFDIRQIGGKYLCDSAWCASFVTLVLKETNIPNDTPYNPDAYVSPDIRVDEYVNYYNKNGRFHLNPKANDCGFLTANGEYVAFNEGCIAKEPYSPSEGDLITFDWDRNGEPDHIGFFVSCDNNRLKTVEGNPGSAEWYETRVAELDNDFGHYNENYISTLLTCIGRTATPGWRKSSPIFIGNSLLGARLQPRHEFPFIILLFELIKLLIIRIIDFIQC